MIQDPIVLIVVLLVIELAVLRTAKRFPQLFSFLPSVFWIYFLPMLIASLGLIDSKAPILPKITNLILPMALFLLLIGVDIKAILRLGPRVLAMFLAGSFGVMAGIAIVFGLFKEGIGREFAPGFAALSGSWTGGSANMIAVKEALSVPDQVFLPMVMVDTIVPYIWMGLLMAAAGFAPRIDQWNKADRSILDDLNKKIHDLPHLAMQKPSLLVTAGILFLGLAGGLISIYAGRFLPEIPGVISSYAWTIILVSLLGIGLSFTSLKKVEEFGSNKIGYFLLFFVLTSIGARASLARMDSALILIAAGFLIVLIHALILFLAARILRAPICLAAAASQANVGGVASAPVVAEIYQKGFASVGLLMAITGNIIGSYIGIAMGQILNFIAK